MSFKLRSTEVREKKQRHGFVYFLAMIAVILFAGYAVINVVNSQITIRENMKKLDELKAETKAIEENNEQITAYLEDKNKLNEYIEDIARNKLDYANPDERIYMLVPTAE